MTEAIALRSHDSNDAGALIAQMGARARQAAHRLAGAPTADKARALTGAARAIRAAADAILAANAADVSRATANGLSAAMIDRLTLNPARIEAMAAGLEAVAALPDPVGQTIDETRRPNGLLLQRVRVPLGVIGIIYESRPNVTADAGALSLMSGNACILRGGSEATESNRAIHAAMTEGVRAAGLPADAIQLVPVADRAAVGAMLAAQGLIDIIVPRGGKSLVARVQDEARVPVLAHLDGIVHLYIDRSADPAKAVPLAVNAKMRRTGICGATETVLIDRAYPAAGSIVTALLDAGCEVRGDAAAQKANADVKRASEQDWSTEYLDAIISVKMVDGVDAALEHIRKYGSQHTDCIIANDKDTAERFLARLDSAIVLHNASTQFADGGEFGMGAEIGIATGRLHARGPVGVEQLTTFKYVVRGTGQVRPG